MNKNLEQEDSTSGKRKEETSLRKGSEGNEFNLWEDRVQRREIEGSPGCVCFLLCRRYGKGGDEKLWRAA